MNARYTIANAAVVLLVALTTNTAALDPALNLPKTLSPLGVVPDAGTPSGPPADANTCPADNLGVLTGAAGTCSITGTTIGSTDDFLAGCGSNPGGQDEIFEFSVDVPGMWGLDSCTVPACWDTVLEIREDTGAGCPGDPVACDGDGCNVGHFESGLSTFLTSGTTYYLIVGASDEPIRLSPGKEEK